MKFTWPWTSAKYYEDSRGKTPSASDVVGKLSQNMEEKTEQMQKLAESVKGIWQEMYKRNLELARENKGLRRKLGGE